MPARPLEAGKPLVAPMEGEENGFRKTTQQFKKGGKDDVEKNPTIFRIKDKG